MSNGFLDVRDVDELHDLAVKDKKQMKMYSDAIYDLQQEVGDYLNIKYGNKRISELGLEELNDMEVEALINAL